MSRLSSVRPFFKTFEQGVARLSRSRFGVVLTALVGTVASVGVFLLVLSAERQVALNDFENRSKNFLQAINRDLEDTSTLLRTLSAFFEASQKRVTQAEFVHFSRGLQARVRGLRDVGWAPRVTHAEREAFEFEVRASGLPDFAIWDRDGSGQRVRAGDRDEYYPLLYLDSNAVARPVLGYDLLSEPTRKSVIERALTIRQPAATPPIKLITVKRPRGGVLGIMPVWRHGADGAVDRVDGVVTGAIEIDEMMGNILAHRSTLEGINAYVFELPSASTAASAADAHGDDRLIYWRSTQSEPAPPRRELLAGAHWQGTVSMMNQQWGVIFSPNRAPAQAAMNWHAVMPLVVGLSMTAFGVLHLLISLRHTARLERLTAELRQTTDDLHRNADKIAHMARHDALTALPNRTLLRERLEEAVMRLGRGVPFALLCLDLDRFKAVNDSLGHAAGDRLLQEAAQRMTACVREIDTVARLGGDEFAVLLADTASVDLAHQVSQRLIEAISVPCELGATRATVGLSVGVAMAPGDGTSAEALLVHADQALYAAKAAGRGRYRFFEAAMNQAMETKPVPALPVGIAATP